MAEYSENGLAMWWDTADAPAPSGTVSAGETARVTVGVRPPGPANTLTVRYRVDEGRERELRGYPRPFGSRADRQYLVADFPALPGGSVVSWLPEIACAGRRADPARGGHPPRTFVVARPDTPAGKPPPPAAADAPFPYTMERVARVAVPLDRHPQVVGETPDGLRINFYLGRGGRAAGPRFEATVDHHGGDWMRIRPDGVGIVDLRATFLTPDGAVIVADYSGTFELGEDGYRNALANRFPSRPRVQLAPRLLTASARYAWMNRLQFIGLGYVEMDRLLVRYDLYAFDNHPPAERAETPAHG